MNPAILDKYLNKFGKLKRHPSPDHGQAPHKPILLLVILDEIENGDIKDNLIELIPELVVTFQAYWQALVIDPHWRPKIEYPFRHLYQEGFWHFVVYDQEVAPEPVSYTLKQLKESFDGVRLDPELWQLLQDKTAVDALRKHLLQTYFQVNQIQREATMILLNAAAEKLKSEAESKFRVRKVREINDEGYFVRHALFPFVIKDLYNFTCAVCGVAARIGLRSTVIDAAHVLPFAEFHLDDPRNGIAFCKNHHWGFDTGGFAIGDNYNVILSPQLKSSEQFLPPNSALTLPENRLYAPDPAALAWHRKNIFKP